MYFLPVVIVVHEVQRLASALVVKCSADLLHLGRQTQAAKALGKSTHKVISTESPDCLI